MRESELTRKRRIVIAKKIRKWLGVRRGSRIRFVEKGGKLILRPLNRPYFESLAGVLAKDGKILKSLMKDKQMERGM